MSHVPVSVPAAKSQGTGIHWQVGQATSLFNIKFVMSSAPDTAHQGIWMEDGSGGIISDLEFNGGKYGIWAGNQQFTVRNVVFNGVNTAVFASWNWGWTFQGVTINNCQVGFDLTTGGVATDSQTVGAEAIIDATVTQTEIFVYSSAASNGSLDGSLVLKNIELTNVSVAVGAGDGDAVLLGSPLGIQTINSWVQGNVYTGSIPDGRFIQGDFDYEDIPVSEFVSVKDLGAKGDGRFAYMTTACQQCDSKVIFFDAGVYIITTYIGEAWSEISGKGDYFSDIAEGHQAELSQLPGAIILEWNVRGDDDNLAGPGMWDSHVVYVIYMFYDEGSGMDSAHCPVGSEDVSCAPAFLGLHLTSEATAYLEGTWVWLADHDLDGDGETQTTLFSGRGILSESRGPVWMVGTAEHHSLYQYNLVNASDHYMGLIQTETPYFQPVPPAPGPFGILNGYNDPAFDSDITSAWALQGTALYSFFNNYSQTCLTTVSCQPQIVDISSDSEVYISSLSTIGATYQLSVDEST
ncbi:glycoside hydrolase family 55 protein, partial [Desarmillaria tabescens]